jgi:CheY-specific phosphatase CheX
MTFDQDIGDAVELIVTEALCDMFGMVIRRERGDEDPFRDGPVYSGVVHIVGRWSGAVSVQICEHGARYLAEQIFLPSLSKEDISLELMLDTIQELTNMLGGNLKRLVGGHCRLSVPKVLTQEDYNHYLVDCGDIARQVFSLGEGSILVRVHESTTILDIPGTSQPG